MSTIPPWRHMVWKVVVIGIRKFIEHSDSGYLAKKVVEPKTRRCQKKPNPHHTANTTCFTFFLPCHSKLTNQNVVFLLLIRASTWLREFIFDASSFSPLSVAGIPSGQGVLVRPAGTKKNTKTWTARLPLWHAQFHVIRAGVAYRRTWDRCMYTELSPIGRCRYELQVHVANQQRSYESWTDSTV